MQVRPPDAAEIDHLARLWHDGWHQTHAPLVPKELISLRTRKNFRERLQAAFPNVRVAGPLGAPIGFYALKGDELYLLFVSPEAHGSGVAAALIADAEARLAEHGVETAWLACAVGNDRAARLREERLVLGPYGSQPGGDVERPVCAGSMALRETVHTLDVSTPH